jgi:hypothetical protein
MGIWQLIGGILNTNLVPNSIYSIHINRSAQHKYIDQHIELFNLETNKKFSNKIEEFIKKFNSI